MSGIQAKQKKSEKNKDKESVQHDDTSIGSKTPTGDEDTSLSSQPPAHSQANDGDEETVAEKVNEANDNESISKTDGKPEKKGEQKKTVHDQPSRKTEKAKTAKPTVPYEDHSTMYIVFVVISILTVGAISFFLPPSSDDNIDIEKNLQQLANDFQNQSPVSFKKLKSRVMPYIQHKTSPQPFVLLVASTQDNQLTAECFATRVAKLLATSPVSINGSKYLEDGFDDVKKDIDRRLRDVFSEGKFPTAAVIHNLDLIPYGTTNLFYAYCDHDNPMYKEAAMIFTITLPQNYQITDNEVDREGLVEKYLSEHSPWVKDQSFDIDVMGALISRITDTVIVVNKESSKALQKSC